METLHIPIYQMVVDEDGLGLFGISFVDDPAIETDFVAFRNDDRMKMYLVSSEKHEVVSPLMIPEQLIYRETEAGEPYYIRADKDTIRLAAQKYLLSGQFNNFTYMHENIDMDMSKRVKNNIYLKRLWIIEDVENDDANTKYGFNLPEGTLMVHAKVLNRDMWRRIKSGELRGLSLEGFFRMKKTNKRVEIEFNKMTNKIDYNERELSLFEKFVQFLNSVQAEAEDVASVAKDDETESGYVELKYYLDDEHYLTVDREGFVRDEQMNVIGEGEYKLSDGNVLVVDDKGKFVETKAVADAEGNEDEIEAPITEKKEEEDEDNKEDKEDEVGEEPEVSDIPDDVQPADVEPQPTDEERGEDEPKQDEETEDVEIDGEIFTLPKKVADYINDLAAQILGFNEELTQMREVTPSAEPVVANVTEGKSDWLSNGISRLNYFKKMTVK